jgi:RimJ/RimL family protein N-acetyltransferase
VITIRSITADAAERFAALGTTNLLTQLTNSWSTGASRPDWTLIAEDDGRPIARGALIAEPMGGGVSTLEGTAAFLWADFDHPRHADAFGALIDAIAERLAPHGPTTLDRRLNPEIHIDIDRMRALLEGSGFALFQEKVGFAWAPSAISSPAAAGVRLVSLADAGREAFRDVMAATTSGTLDRNDRYYIARCGPEPWAEEIMTALRDGDETSWLLVYHGDEPAGFVAVSAFDEDTWTIVHIGVVPPHRGHGHVLELLSAADDVARQRGFTGGLSDVDVENAPMIAAMERAGHRTELRPWHIWHYRREVPYG